MEKYPIFHQKIKHSSDYEKIMLERYFWVLQSLKGPFELTLRSLEFENSNYS